MAQWGNTDDAGNSVLWATNYVNLPANSTNQTNVFGNTTIGAFNNNGVAMNKAVGQFGLDTTEIAVSNAAVISYIVTSGGSGYGANAAVTVANSTGGSNTSAANSTVVNSGATPGRVTSVNVNTAIAGYSTKPAVTIAAPASINITANTQGFSNTTDTLVVSSANSRFAVGDRVFYTVPTNNTAIAGLTSNTYYWISFANTTTVALAASKGGANVDITSGITAAGETHTIQGDTATAAAVLSGVPHGAAHTGWVLRTVGTGNRAGRIQYECLVAMGGNFSNDAEDTVLPDA